MHCGEVNFQDIGQCKNCGRTEFISEEKFEKERRKGAAAMITGPIFFFISLGLLLYRYYGSAKSDLPKWVMLPFVLIGFFVTVDGAFRYARGRGSMVLNVILTLCVLAFLVIGIYYDVF